jgi:hypothetical protein
MTSRPLRVFLCHSSADKPAVRELYQKLRAETWIEPWLDEKELFPGMDWNLEIEKAIEVTDVILVCLSNNSITKEGYVQREIRIALDYADYKPEGTLFIIPVRLEECEPPRRLRMFQYVDFFPKKERGKIVARIIKSLRIRASEMGLQNHFSTDPAQEYFELEYGRWRLRHSIMSFESLEFVFINRAKIKIDLEDKWVCVLVAALKNQSHLDEWIDLCKRKDINAIVNILIGSSPKESQQLIAIYREIKSILSLK